jgi:hypothetical protein
LNNNFSSIRNFFFLRSGFLLSSGLLAVGSFSGCFSVVFSGDEFSGYGLIFAPFCFFALEGLEIVFLSCCFFYVAIFWHFLSFL